MTPKKDELRCITLDIPKHGRIEIWVDAANNRFCIGPPRGPLSSALVMMQVDPHVFFAAPQGPQP